MTTGEEPRDGGVAAYRSLESLMQWLSGHVDVDMTKGEAKADMGCNDGG